MKFTGKRALVTGAGAGIGRGIALKLAEEGAEVIALTCIQSELESLIEENRSIQTICVDLTDIKRVEEEVKKFLPIHLLVNNAGIGLPGNPLEVTGEDFDSIFGVNVKAALRLTQIISKDLIERSLTGSIVNISSVAGHRAGWPKSMLYGCSKASLNMMTQVFASALGAKGIRVNAVSPTLVLTAMGKKPTIDEEKRAKLLEKIPQRRFAEVKDVVNSTLFLLSEESQMVNGHLLPVDGGQLACL